MKLPKEAIEEFKAIYKRNMHKDISDELAEIYGVRLIRLILLAQPMSNEKIKMKFKDLFQEEEQVRYNYFASKVKKKRSRIGL